MMSVEWIRRWLGLGLLIGLVGCQTSDPPAPESEAYASIVSDAHVAFVATQTDQLPFAIEKMESLTERAPREAAFWSNLAVQRLRFGDLEQARAAIREAMALEPDEALFLFNAAEIESRFGDLEAAVDYYDQAAEREPDHILYSVSWVFEADRLDDPSLEAKQVERLEQAHRLAPDNQVILFERLRLAIRSESTAAVSDWLSRLREAVDDPGPELGTQLDRIGELMDEESVRSLVPELSYLRHLLEMDPGFALELDQVRRPPSEPGLWANEWFWLQPEGGRPARIDSTLRFQESPVLPDQVVRRIPEQAQWVGVWTLLEDRPPLPVWIDENEIQIDEQIRIPLPEGVEPSGLHADQIQTLDVNQSFRNDLVVATESGLSLYLHGEDGRFQDVSSEWLPPEVRNGSWRRVWVVDLDQDGDLDLVLSSEEESVWLTHTGEAYVRWEQPPSVRPLQRVIGSDMTADGAMDLLLLDLDGRITFFENERQGRYRNVELPEGSSPVLDLGVEDLNGDGWMDLVWLNREGALIRTERNRQDGLWVSEQWAEGVLGDCEPDCNQGAILLADMDLNGQLDVVLSTDEQTWIWLADDSGRLTLLDAEIPGGLMDRADLDGDNRLDLVGRMEGTGAWVRYSTGSDQLNGQTIRVRASGTEGDRRINSFGLGGELEVRAGALHVRRRIDRANVHVGLGPYKEADMIRILWPNGSVQAEFRELGMGSTIQNEQLLKGSCPWLFAHDGESFGFVTDAIWRSPLGLRINAQETLGEVQTFDRVRVSADQLVATDGRYRLRMTAELWETHFFDHMRLQAIDHPEGTVLHVDERFVFPAPDLTPRLFSTPVPVARVTDDRGVDRTDEIRERDGIYLQAFEKTPYQGLAEPHHIEIQLRDGVEDPTLLLSGWLRPTDSSINLALGQGTGSGPSGLRVEVSGEGEEWRLLHEDYGVPAGKEKTILLDLDGVFESEDGRRVRLTTTSEIYWDAVLQAEALPDSLWQMRRAKPVREELAFRGYSEVSRADAQSPALPNYGEISGTATRWFDLAGFYTRFGDVGELLDEVDDRYVIMNAGDELIVEYEALSEPREGMIRTFLFDSDGWVKDGDVNTEGSATVGPLPYHDMPESEHRRDADLASDPVYKRFKEDWMTYHTRYVHPGLLPAVTRNHEQRTP